MKGTILNFSTQINAEPISVDDPTKTCVTVFGIGGGGGNTIQYIIQQQISDINFVCVDTDQFALNRITTSNKILLDTNEEKFRKTIHQSLKGTDIVFIIAGMSGNTGTTTAPIIAEIAKEMGLLTIGIVTTPFQFEGHKRHQVAEQGLKALKNYIDSLIIIPNQRLLEVYDNLSMNDAYKKVDGMLFDVVLSGHELMINQDEINLASLTTAMNTRGYTMLNIGIGRGIVTEFPSKQTEKIHSQPMSIQDYLHHQNQLS